MSNIPSIIGGLIALAAVKRLTDTKPTVVTPLVPKQIAPAPKQTFVNILDVRPDIRPKGITPFITVKQRAEQAAFQRRQEAMTREQLLSRYGL